jgi:hypothetical protein
VRNHSKASKPLRRCDPRHSGRHGTSLVLGVEGGQMKLTILFVVVSVILFLWLRSVTIYLAVHKGQIPCRRYCKAGSARCRKAATRTGGDLL